MKKIIVPLGPYHPLFEEPELFFLHCDGEQVMDVEWQAGYNHRGIEKLSESQHWDQVTFLVERICGICSNSHPMAYSNAVENLLGLDIPERAKYIRTIISEMERLHNHFLWVGLAGHFLGYNTVFMWAWKYRESILDMFEVITGGRNNYSMIKIGGVRRDINDEQVKMLRNRLDTINSQFEMLTKAFLDDPILQARLVNVGVLTKKDVKDYGAVGPIARASGVDIDVRRDNPYAAYNLVDWKVITRENGDVFDKAVVRLLEAFESIKIIRQCLDRIENKKGEILAQVTEIPPGEGIGRHEALRGEVFHYIRSDGSSSPVRHKIRAPSYVNVPTFKKSCVGQTISDVAIILAGVDPCYCCTERVAIYDANTGKKKNITWADIVKKSQKKTEKLKKHG